DLTFSQAMNTTSFDPAADLVSFTGPAGNLLPYVTGFSWPTSSRLHLTFAPQAVPGTYTLALGPQILDAGGIPLDQNNNGVAGEPGDGVTVTFPLGVDAGADAAGYRYAPVAYDPSLNLDPSAAGVVTLPFASV